MPFLRILQQVHAMPWFSTPAAYRAVSELVRICSERASSGTPDPLNVGIDLRDLQERRPMTIDQNGIAHIHVLGVLGRGLAPIEKSCGRTDYEDIDREIDMASNRARAYMFDFDTPGGAAVGLDQTAEHIANISVPKAGACENEIASAGYFLGAGLDKLFLGSGAMAGCIGTILPWVDSSKSQQILGYKATPFVNEGASFKGIRQDVPLNEEQSAYLQDMVNRMGERFHQHILNYRTPDEEVWKAGVYIGQDAVDLGLADGLGGRAAAMEYLLTALRS